uniref:Uncharacterized protein LOC114342042 n=1 Tax=Diabrotica virgifera virgifera TaxID=50390 RepID=A0A6P7GRG3_DIAVI
MLPSPSNMDSLVIAVFESLEDKRASKFRQSVQYYLNGTASGFLKYCTPPIKSKPKKNSSAQHNHSIANTKSEDQDLDTSGFASETTEQEQETLQNYRQATAHSIIGEFEGLDSGLLKNSQSHDSSISDSSKYNGFSNGSTSSGRNTAGNSSNRITQPAGPNISTITAKASKSSSTSEYYQIMSQMISINFTAKMCLEKNLNNFACLEQNKNLEKLLFVSLFLGRYLRQSENFPSFYNSLIQICLSDWRVAVIYPKN